MKVLVNESLYELKSDKTYRLLSICDNKELVVIPKLIDNKEVSSIAIKAIVDNENIKFLYIPRSINIIDDLAIYNCNNLETIIVSKNNKYYDSRDNSNALIDSKSNELMVGCKSTIIPEGIKSIKSYAFYKVRKFYEHIVLPSTLELIKKKAFYKCSGLFMISIPDGVTKIEDSAFEGCINLVKVTFSDNLTNIGSCCFKDCERIERIKLPKNLEVLSLSIFNNCRNLKEVIINRSIKYIGINVFKNCDNLKTIKYLGTKEEWLKIEKSERWSIDSRIEIIQCIDGILKLGGIMAYTVEKTINDFYEENDKRPYERTCINRTGETKDTNECYAEVLAKSIFEDEKFDIRYYKEEDKIKHNFYNGNHNGKYEKSKVSEKALCRYWYNNGLPEKLKALGDCVDYETNLIKRKKTNIDLTTYNNGYLNICEVKGKYTKNGYYESDETLLRCILEIETYFETLASNNNIGTYIKTIKSKVRFDRSKVKEIKKVIIVPSDSVAAIQYFNRENTPYLNRLLIDYGLTVYIYDKYTKGPWSE